VVSIAGGLQPLEKGDRNSGRANMLNGVKLMIKSALARIGYRVSAIPPAPRDPDSLVASGLAPSECYARFHSDCPIFQPWLGHGEFASAYEGVKEKTLVSADRCYLLWKFAQHALSLDGAFIECGVYRGGTALMLARMLSGSDRKLWLFDSFEGLPNSQPDKGDHYERGAFGDTSVEGVAKLLKPFAGSIEIKKGWIPTSFQGAEELRFSLAHVDVDLYEPALECCRFIFPRLASGGVMIFDDYGFPSCRGERTAVDDYFAEQKRTVISLPTGQALVIKV